MRPAYRGSGWRCVSVLTRLRGVAIAETKAAAHCAGAQARAAEIQFAAAIFCMMQILGQVCARP